MPPPPGAGHRPPPPGASQHPPPPDWGSAAPPPPPDWRTGGATQPWQTDPARVRRRRRLALRFLAISAVAAVVGAIVAAVVLVPAARDLLILDSDLIGRVEPESSGTIELAEGDHFLVAVGRRMTRGSSDVRPAVPRVRLTGPDGEQISIRSPGYDSQTTTGDQRIVVGEFTVTSAGAHRLDVDTSPTIGLNSMAISEKPEVSLGRLLLGGAAGVMAGLSVLGMIVSGIIAFIAHRELKRSEPFGPGTG